MGRASAADIVGCYERYLEVCNRHAWHELDALVATRVVVNAHRRTREEYIDDLARRGRAFPRSQWEVANACARGEWLAVHAHRTGPGAGPSRGISAGDLGVGVGHEFTMYRIVDGLITEVEDTAESPPMIS